MEASKVYRIAAQAACAAAIKIAQPPTSCYLLLATNSGLPAAVLGALDLQRACVPTKNRRHVGIDAMNTRMYRGIAQKGEYALLHPGVG
jgi:hypothetical protein